MKKLMYLLVAGTLFIFTACNSGGGAATEEAASDVVPADVAVEEAASDPVAAEEAEDTEEATEETAE